MGSGVSDGQQCMAHVIFGSGAMMLGSKITLMLGLPERQHIRTRRATTGYSKLAAWKLSYHDIIWSRTATYCAASAPLKSSKRAHMRLRSLQRFCSHYFLTAAIGDRLCSLPVIGNGCGVRGA